MTISRLLALLVSLLLATPALSRDVGVIVVDRNGEHVAAEWLQIESFREAWAYYGLNPANTESQLQLSVRLRFGNRYSHE